MVVCLLAWIGCYRPTVVDGGFVCNPGAKPCPDGFLCDPDSLTCRKAGSQDAAAAPDAAAPDAAADDAAGDVACFAPLASCTPATSCDPLCQTGCGCHEKCSANTAGALTCNPPRGSALKAVGASCLVSASGTPAQSDDCQPGLVCVADGCGGGRCYRFCRTNADCPGSACSRDAGGGVEICDVPFAVCDPIGGGARAGCPSTGGIAEGCYLAGAGAPDQTLCDCPFGGQRENDTCATSRDCLPGLVCVDSAGTSDLRCQPACVLQGNGGCSNGRTCVAIGAAATYGYCRP